MAFMKSNSVFTNVALVTAAFILVMATGARASVLASDNFDLYSLGTLSAQTGLGAGFQGNWTAAQNSGAVNVVSPGPGGGNGLQISVPSSSSSIMGARQFAAPITGQNVYVSFLWQYASGPGFGTVNPDNTTFALALSDTATDTSSVLNYGMRATQLAGVETTTLMARQGTGTPVSGAALTLASGTVGNPSLTYQLVAEYVWDGAAYSSINAWFNPNSGTQTTPDVVSPGGTLTSLSYVYFREGAPAVNAVFNADNLTIGSTWSDVVVVPEPGSMVLLALGATALIAFRRRGDIQS
jgi:hypothetical protein